MKDRLDDVQALAEQNAEDIAVINLNLDAIEEEIGQLELWLIETFAKLVTSVEISGTYNNMLGSVNIPGFEPKMLIFNDGVAEKDGKFPTTATVEEPLKWYANEEIGAGEYNPGNAGYIYANVNRYLDLPLLTKDQDEDSFFDFDLVATNGDEADGVIIVNTNEEGDPTDDVLTWGWTRADNNIFKFGVEYNGDEAKNFVPAKLDLSLLKADLKAIWADRNKYSGTSKQSLGHLLADLYYNYATKDTNMKKYALKISWADNTTNKYEKDGEDAEDDYADIVPAEEGDGLKHMVTSEAELVFAAIKPLSFKSGNVIAEQSAAMQGRVNYAAELVAINLLNKIFDKVKAQLPDLSPSQIKTIVATPTLRYTAATDTWELNGGAAGWIDVTSLIKPLNTDLETVQNMLAAALQLENKALSGQTYLEWVYKFTNKANTLITNNADMALYPVLLVQDKDGKVSRVSGLKASPYVAAGEITLKPTSYTAELFAPAYAKFVGCKDIDEDNFNQILFCGDQELKFTPEAGKLYEIVYEAVDFFGNVIANTYYIQGK
jgi:hypothetical protein